MARVMVVHDPYPDCRYVGRVDYNLNLVWTKDANGRPVIRCPGSPRRPRCGNLLRPKKVNVKGIKTEEEED